MSTIITAKNLGKKYIIKHQGRPAYNTLRDVMSDSARRWGRRIFKRQGGDNTAREAFWALKDISFEVAAGERLGIIGRNGAGKSTLLKILSRITEPTSGRVRIRGRIASLLEVGTGFHPELTGRENIFLNGAILGMTRAEIKRKFDEIVAFAEVDKFLDTPVKHFSSGMYVRLAFSVAAHLDPEILLVDEVLAVGDVAFQKKCLGKMDSVSKAEGRTVVFVSHNMQAIRNLCSRSLLIDEGSIIYDGETDAAINTYNQIMRQFVIDAVTAVNNPLYRRGSGAVRFVAISVQDTHGKENCVFAMKDAIRFKLSYQVRQDIPDLAVSVVLRSGLTSEIITSARHVVSISPLKAGHEGTVVIDLPEVIFRPGEYPLYFWLGDHLNRPFDVVDNLTAPLVIKYSDAGGDASINPLQPVGYFSIPSTLVIINRGEITNAQQ